MTNIHSDLPFGTPPAFLRSTLAEASGLEYSDIKSEPALSLSGDDDGTLSTFSCVGDLLPDETADVSLIEAAGTDNDFVAIKRIAQVLAKRRNVDPDTVMPPLLDLFAGQCLESNGRCALAPAFGTFITSPLSPELLKRTKERRSMRFTHTAQFRGINDIVPANVFRRSPALAV